VYNQKGMRTIFRVFKQFTAWLIVGCLMAACGGIEASPSEIASPTDPPLPTATSTIPSPTDTPVPLAVRVNGDVITLAEFEAEVSRYLSGISGDEPVDEQAARRYVLDDLISQVLLAQGARENGFTAEDDFVQDRIDKLTSDAGGEAVFESWLEENLYTHESFEIALARSIEAAWMRDQIIMQVPETADQVHARQILLHTPEEAAQILADLRTGTEFATLAVTYDPIAGGDLGWFPRGYLTDAQLEEAAFNLQPGEYTDVIQTAVGYHILQVIERVDGRLLEPEPLMVLQEEALRDWVEMRRNQAQIETLIT
jgi:peptidyl-prolyl cis-trans isomerase C